MCPFWRAFAVAVDSLVRSPGASKLGILFRGV